MPTITTRGAMSAQGFGFASASLGGPYYIGYYNYSNSAGSRAFTVVTDSSSNAYFLGYDGLGTNNMFAQYSKAGVLGTQKYIATTSPAYWASSAIDASNNIYVVNSAVGSAEFIMKLTTTPAISYQKYVQPTSGVYIVQVQSTQKGPTIAIDSSGNLYGTFLAILNTCCATPYTYIYKLTSTGTKSFTEIVIDTHSPSDVVGISCNGTNIFVLSNGGTGLQRIYKLDLTGALQSTTNLTNYDSYGINSDSSGNVYVAGVIYPGSNNGMYIAKLNGTTISWQKVLTSRAYGTNFFSSIAVDANSNVYVAGHDTDKIPASTPAVYYPIIQLAKYNSSGTIQWQRSITWNGSTYSHSKNLNIGKITLDANGDLIITGWMNYYDVCSVTNYGAFTMKVPPDGSKTGTYTVGSETFVYAVSTQTDAASSATASNPGTMTILNDSGGTSANTGYGPFVTTTHTSTVVAL